MSQAEGEVRTPAGGALVPLGQVERRDDWADLRSAIRLFKRGRPVLVTAVVMVVAQVIWRAQFLSHMYFLREDFFNSDLAAESHLGWRYLTYVGAGHFMVGERLIIWLLVRISLYDWHLAMAMTLACTLAAGLAALKMLRTLFGERPVILLLLAFYLLTPLTVSSLGWWTEALESIPLQIAIFMAVDAQVRFVRTGAGRQFAAALSWVIFGLIFFEKALVLPLLLLAVSVFLEPGGSWLAGARRVLRRYWRLWLAYVAVLIGYAIVFAVALGTSSVRPHAPASLGAVVTFSWGLLKDTLLPGALGGPWHWYPLPGNWYAIAATPREFQWIAVAVAIFVVAASIWRRGNAWQAWAIFAGWLVLADMLPVIVSRLTIYPLLYALDTHYVADAMPVLVLCLGLAFLPVPDPLAGRAGPVPADRHRLRQGGEQAWRTTAAALFAVFVIGSVWSAQDYSRLMTGSPAAIYIAFGTAEIRQAPSGSPVLDSAVPPDVSYQAADNRASRVIGDAVPGHVRWIAKPYGTIDGLRVLAANGLLEKVWVYGTSSGPAAHGGCWPERNGTVRIKFLQPSPYFTTLVRIGYIWGSSAAGTVAVKFGAITRLLPVVPGLHTAYLPVSGSVTGMSVSGISGGSLCVGDAEAGRPAPQVSGHTTARS